MTQRHITIVGAGQSGLQLGIGLLDAGYQVTTISNRTPEEIAGGKVASSQCIFHNALEHERDLGLDFWPDAPTVDGISFTIPHPELPGEKAISWASRLDNHAKSIDQRVKFPKFMEEFTARGGELVFEDAGVAELEKYTQNSDLVIVAAGKGEIAQLFTRDAERSTYDAPQRALALTYVKGLKPREEYSAVSFNLIPGVGEYFVFPALTTTGPCEIMVFEGVPGGPMDYVEGSHSRGAPGELQEHPEHLPAVGGRACHGRGTDRSQRRAPGSLRAYRPPPDCHVAQRQAGTGPGRRRGFERSHHRAGFQQRQQVRGVLSGQHHRPRRTGLRCAVHAGHVRALLGLRAARCTLDKCPPGSAAAPRP